MNKKLLLSLMSAMVMTGCASVPTVSDSQSTKAKEFNMPSEGKAGIYVYRIDSVFGAALKKDIYIEDECIGETAPGVFFYHEVEGGKNQTVSTESEFSANEVSLLAESGQLYFIEQYMKMGAFVGGAGLNKVESDVGKSEVIKLSMAEKGTCSNQG
ncbi:DUF2846 domain-containing protein [Photobacterium makurazakiensis]|uniref:DUF2846 domain-containing protein n=1 Tax=Photobacterium TaxID=657 RepID=UPI003D118E2E